MIVLAFVVGFMLQGMMKNMCGGRLIEGLNWNCVPNFNPNAWNPDGTLKPEFVEDCATTEKDCSKDDSLFKYGIASINTMACSKFVNQLFEDNKNKDLNVKCSYHKDFNKWVPYEEVLDISDYNTIKTMEI